MEFRILGSFEVVRDGEALALGSGRQLALVAVLLLHRNQTVSVDRLVEDLWDGTPPPTAAKIVRNYVSLLRKELGDRLVTRPPGYVLRIDEDELDSRRLERAVESGDQAELDAALGLWRGAPLSQFTYERFAQTEIARLEELHVVALEKRIEAQLALGEHAAVVGDLERLVQAHPLRERLCELLMLALYRSGRQAEALDAYRRTRRHLDEELGIEPGHSLRELERKILNQDPSLAAPEAVAVAPARASRKRLRVVAPAVAIVALLVAVAAILGARDSAGGLGELSPNSVGVIDPGTNALVSAIQVGIRPGPVAAGTGAVWVGNLQDQSLTRIDPQRRAPTGTFALDNRTPTGLAIGAGAVWVAHGGSGELSRVELQFGRVTHTLVLTSPPYATPHGGVAFGAGYVWSVFGDSSLVRVDPENVRMEGSALAGASSAAVVLGEGAVWVANAGDATVQRFDPTTFEEGPIRDVSVGRRPIALAYGAGAVWVASEGEDAVTRIDPSTGSTVTIPVGDGPSAVAFGAGAVWVANAGDGTVSRIDPDANRVERTIGVGAAPAGIAVSDGFVWVAAQAP